MSEDKIPDRPPHHKPVPADAKAQDVHQPNRVTGPTPKEETMDTKNSPAVKNGSLKVHMDRLAWMVDALDGLGQVIVDETLDDLVRSKLGFAVQLLSDCLAEAHMALDKYLEQGAPPAAQAA